MPWGPDPWPFSVFGQTFFFVRFSFFFVGATEAPGGALKGPRRAQEGQEWRQDGPRKGPGRQRLGPGGRPEGTGMPSRSRDGTLGFGAPSLLRIFDFFVGFYVFPLRFSFGIPGDFAFFCF